MSEFIFLFVFTVLNISLKTWFVIFLFISHLSQYFCKASSLFFDVNFFPLQLTNTYSDFRRTYPQYKFLPETIKTPEEYAEFNIAIYFNDNIPADDKIKRANTLITNLKKRKGGKPGAVESQIAIETSQCYVGIIKNPNATADDKVKANKFLNAVISSNNDDVKVLIEEYIKDYKTRIK